MAEAKHATGAPLWGVSAEFDTAEAMLAALHLLRDRGLGRLEAYSPVPVPGAAAALRVPALPIIPIATAGAVLGGAAMFAMCSYATIVSYRFAIGGRPLFSWPSFVVPSVSFAALAGALVSMAAMLVFSRLPRLNHPAFNIRNFPRATENRFFVAVEARGENFDADVVEAAFAELTLPPRQVGRVPR